MCKFQERLFVMVTPSSLADDISYRHCNKLRNKLVSETNAEKLIENHLCPTRKTIQSPMRYHNKIDHLRATVYCLRDVRLNCELTCFETGRLLTKKHVYHIFSDYNQDMDSCYNQRLNRLSFSLSERPYL